MPQLTPEQFEHYLSFLRGTFAIEGMTLSDKTIQYLQRIANGESTSDQIIQEILQGYSSNTISGAASDVS
jgi:hypothetical protein